MENVTNSFTKIKKLQINLPNELNIVHSSFLYFNEEYEKDKSTILQ